MYLKHFGLHEAPFSLTPDTSYFFAHESHREAINVLLVALSSGEGFIKVTGEVGLGKTLLCRKLLNSLNDPVVTAYIPNPHLSAGAMRQAIAEELGIVTPSRATQHDVVRMLTQRLLELASESKRIIVIIDEAQELPEKTLEAVRLLTNLETEKRKLLQVVLFGQPELDERLNQPGIRQLRQRITFSYKLKPLDLAAMTEYIRHRLRIAGYRGSPLFDEQALRLIYKASRGTPRLVNILCNKCLLAAYGRGDEHIQRWHAKQAIADTEDVSRISASWRPVAMGGALAASVLLAVWSMRTYWAGWLP